MREKHQLVAFHKGPEQGLYGLGPGQEPPTQVMCPDSNCKPQTEPHRPGLGSL